MPAETDPARQAERPRMAREALSTRTGAVSVPPTGRVGVVDIGSNTVRLVVYESPTRLPFPIFNEKAQCALGLGLGGSGKLNPKGVPEALRSLKRFVRLAAAMGVDRLQLVATAAVRDAEDGPAFVAEAEQVCQMPVTVLSGAEEARLAAEGVLNGVPGADGVLGDLGGGSLDLVSLDMGKAGSFATLPLGHLRLAEDSGGNRSTARSILVREFARVPWLDTIGGRSVYAVGGSWRALARVFIDQTHHPLHVIDNFTIAYDDALRLATLIAGLSASSLAKLSITDVRRLESLPFAAASVAALLEATRPRQLVFSAFGMREGQMLELLPKALRLQDPLISACERQAEQTGRFVIHGQEIVDWMTPLFPHERESERRIRYAASLLSDIGWSEHPDYRAVHAFHRVLRIPYAGLTHPDRAELAVVVLIRYGGAESDRMVAPIRNLLDEARLARARAIGLALRLAQTLSGGAPGLLEQTRLTIAGDRLILVLPADGSVLASEAVDRRFERLARALDLKPVMLTGER